MILSPTQKSIARHIGTISWNGLLDTISMLITGAGLGVLLTLIVLSASGTPFMVQITDATGTTLYGPRELTPLLWKGVVVGLGVLFPSVGVFMALTGRFVFMSRTFAAISAAASDLLRHGPGLARRARLRTERQD